MSINSVADTSLSAETVATVRRWLDESAAAAPEPSAARLAALLKDPGGLGFTLDFVDGVLRPEDLRVAARNFEGLTHRIPDFLPWYLRLAVAAGGGFATLFPRPIVPIARWLFRRLVGHLVLDARPQKLDLAIGRLRTGGVRLNLNVLGEAVLGDAEADRRLQANLELLGRDDVDAVSVKVSNISSQLSMWAFDETVDRVAGRLLPLYELAAASAAPKLITLDMEEFRDLDLTVAVFTRLLEKKQLQHLEAGIVLQAYLPDALRALQGLTVWATARRKAGGAGIRVRLVKGANLPMERVEATMHGWPLATYETKRETDSNYKRLLDYALTPRHTDAVRIGVASHNLFDVAWAWRLAVQRRVDPRVEFEMLLGMATAQAEVVKRDVGGLLLYAPVVQPDDFDSAINYLVRRFEENASPENFVSAAYELDESEPLFIRERDRFLASLDGLDAAVPASHRLQNRGDRVLDHREGARFANEPDTDPSIATNRTWGLSILRRSRTSRLGAGTIATAVISDAASLETLIRTTRDVGLRWGSRPVSERSALLRDAADVLAAFRGRLIEIMVNETGKTLAEADVEVSEAVDFARYYAAQAPELEAVEGARFVPSALTVVTPPWNFPVAIPAGSVLAALAAGSAVVLKPAPQARRCAAVLVEAMWEAGVPRDLLRLVDVKEGPLGQQLVAHPAVDRVILTGSWQTAGLFRSWRADMPLHAETSGKNAIIVTPSADLDLAVRDIATSAFGHSGQKCSAASLVILVGSVGSSERFRRKLVDAVATLRVGMAQDPLTQLGPLIEQPAGALLAALTRLNEGESWLVEPRQLDERLWTPGVRAGVAPGSEMHLTECFGPVLGVMTASSLDEAIELQNGSAYGLTAGIHSLDPHEVAVWLQSVEAGNLYVNRPITGAVVQRQPFGGWKRSSVGTGAKAGGPNYLLTLGSWSAVAPAESEDLRLDELSHDVAVIIKKAQAGLGFADFGWVRSAALNDEEAWQAEFGQGRDVSALGIERNVLRYRPAALTIRLAEGQPLAQLVRLVAAAARTRAQITISSALPLPVGMLAVFDGPLPAARVQAVHIETDAAWLARAAAGGITTPRIRLVGGDPVALAEALGGDPDVAVYAGEVTVAGRVELLAFLREQSVSITAHRYGRPDARLAELVV